MSAETLSIIWFLLLGVLLTGYAILDGFDLGVGILHPFIAHSDEERRTVLNAIGPLWDGNEVWLVTFGGALFAAFPAAYATVFSGFYSALVLLLMGLIARAVALEFRSKVGAARWRRFWDWVFCGGSSVATLIFGVAVGNAMRGVRIDEQGTMVSSLVEQLNPYSLTVGLLVLALFALHGGLFLYLKTSGALQQRLRGVMWRACGLLLAAFMLTTIFTLIAVPRATVNLRQWTWAPLIVIANVLAACNIPRCLYREKPRQAFASSSLLIAGLTALFGIALYPNLLTASGDISHSLTIFSAASSPRTLMIMLFIAAIGMPFVLTYTTVIYWTFRGKVELHDTSY